MSRVSPTNRREDTFLFRDAVAELGAELIGSKLQATYGTWPMYSKFFDYQLPLFHHLHLDDASAGSLMDWEKNVDPDYRKHYFRPPVPCPSAGEGCSERWIVCGNSYVAAKELVLQPGRSVVVRDAAAYSCIIVQGFGRFGRWDAEATGVLRFGQLSGDEYFVGSGAAREGVAIVNASAWEPMVILKHFGPDNPETPGA